MRLIHLPLLLSSIIGVTTAASSFTPARPPALPLAVKSPYLNTWLPAGRDGGNGGYLAGEWPIFWAGQVAAWAGLIRVDGDAYTWMGAVRGRNGSDVQTVTQIAYSYTSTKSVFTMDVGGKVEMSITFLSPVTPHDYKRQSLIFSYLNVEVTSTDGSEHDVQLYSDISAEWVSGNRSDIASWDHDTTSTLSYHRARRQEQLAYSEVSDQSQWGDYYWATEDSETLTFQSGGDAVVRGSFLSNGSLPDTKDTNFRPINEDYPVFGFAKDLGNVGSAGIDTLFTIGLCQDYAIQFNGSDGYQPQPSLWKSYFDSDTDAIDWFYQDYSTSSEMSAELDSKIQSDSVGAAGQKYATLTTLSVLQAFAAIQLVGTSEKMYIFQKEISSNGNMNTVDVIFPFHPLLLYTNPELLAILLEPLWEIQEGGNYPNKYSMHDIGAHYPNATGHPDGLDEEMPVEECGNMLIMALAYVQHTGKTDYLKAHYKLLKQWTQFLVSDSLIPASQLSTDDFAGHLENQTNLALKGIIGIGAMGQIANLTGNTEDAANYTAISRDYIEKWEDLGIAKNANPPHTTLAYGQNKTHGLLYNIFSDRQLSLDLVPQSIYDMQSEFYPTVEGRYGVPLDTRHSYTKGDWEMWAAAVSSSSTRDMFIADLAKWINETPTNKALSDLYDTETGDYPVDTPQFIARPVVGGVFSLLVLPGAAGGSSGA
ncbi:glutaminase GtaA [Aulographum hederae CBS 113979]|uniref:Glutaminase GtaA n=1 Tax=Aulographum hederae CBS 113979 TaxID=1176131 RepID=A0A6G1GTB5_9PEZI|nr:glutaminase GtaA [Aulographum hederae CBS 113979]